MLDSTVLVFAPLIKRFHEDRWCSVIDLALVATPATKRLCKAICHALISASSGEKLKKCFNIVKLRFLECYLLLSTNC